MTCFVNSHTYVYPYTTYKYINTYNPTILCNLYSMCLYTYFLLFLCYSILYIEGQVNLLSYTPKL